MSGDPFSSAIDAALNHQVHTHTSDGGASSATPATADGSSGMNDPSPVEEMVARSRAQTHDGTDVSDPSTAVETRTLSDFRCTHRQATGTSLRKCTKLALPGTRHCVEHTPRSEVDIADLAADVKEQAALDLMEHTPAAIATLAEVMNDPAAPPGIRAKASEAILDRVGIRGGIEIRVKEEVNVEITRVIEDRLERLLPREIALTPEPSPAAEEAELDILEGEVIDE